jgi:hypothetical protein
MANIDTILQRVKKLMALADPKGGATVEEAASAASKAQQLLHDHKLCMADVAKIESRQDPFDAVKESLTPKRPRNVWWRRSLFNIIARTCYCRVVWLTSENKMMLIGARADAEVVVCLYGYLSAMLIKECRRTGKGEPQWKKGFMVGALHVLHTRLDEAFQRRKAESAKSTALVVCNDKALAERVHQMFPNLQKGRATSMHGIRADAHAHGEKFAGTIPLHRGVARETSNQRQIGGRV